MSFNGREVEVLFTGRFNAYNLTAVYAASVLIGWPVEQVLVAMSRLVPVAGRFQAFHSPKGIHSNCRLRAYSRCRCQRTPGHTRGSGHTGLNHHRSRCRRKPRQRQTSHHGKRSCSAQRPAHTYLRQPARRGTRRHNPRHGGGTRHRRTQKTLSIADRREAIRTAAAIAQPGDVILIAGKGHEDYQEIKGVKHHFDDREVVKEFLL